MEKQQIINGNRLIKDFMGSTIVIEQDDVKNIPLAFLKIPDLKFHLAWKWLMPVVIKIEEDRNYPIRIEETRCTVTIGDENVLEAEADTKLEAVWQAVVSYLEWEK